jgi:hypothetical protein
MAFRRSRKLRERYIEPLNQPDTIPNKELLIELLKSDENGSIPLMNFFENTHYHLGNIHILESKVQELETKNITNIEINKTPEINTPEINKTPETNKTPEISQKLQMRRIHLLELRVQELQSLIKKQVDPISNIRMRKISTYFPKKSKNKEDPVSLKNITHVNKHQVEPSKVEPIKIKENVTEIKITETIDSSLMTNLEHMKQLVNMTKNVSSK